MLDTNLTKVKVIESTPNHGIFEIEPLERGYAQTIGNSLRRVLLSSLPGAAVTAVKINGVKHEYATVPGVEEDVLNIILNIKLLRLKSFSDERQTVYLNVKKTGEVKASDLEVPATVEILNPELVLATVTDAKEAFVMELSVERGVGYLNTPADENARGEISLIPVDANFSPIERVNFEVTSARVGQVTDLDKLTIEIYTRSIDPSVALHEALDLYTRVLKTIEDQIVVEEVEKPLEKKAKTTKKAKK